MTEKKEKKKNHAIEFFLKLAITVAIILILNFFVITVFRVNGNTMFPAVRDGDLCFILKTAKPVTNDVVLYKNPDGKLALARVVGVQGQTIEYNETGVVVDGYAPAETIYYETKQATDSGISYPYTIQDGYYLLNDFRTDITDSRMYGAVDSSKIEGKVLFIFRRRGF